MYQRSINGIVRIEDGAIIPADPNNASYQDYLAWINAGNQPLPLPVDEAKLAKARTVDRWLAEQSATIEWDGHVWQTDAVAQSRLSAEITMAGAGVRPDPSPWRTLDNQMVMLSAVQLQEFAAAIYLHQRNCILESFTLKDAIEAATTIEEVEAIQVSSQP